MGGGTDAARAVEDPARAARRRVARILFLSAFALVVLWLAYVVRAVLNPFLIALLIAYILNPIVTRYEKRGHGRQRIVYGLFILIALVCVLFAIFTYYQVRSLALELRPVVLDSETGVVARARDTIEKRLGGGEDWQKEIAARLEAEAPKIVERALVTVEWLYEALVHRAFWWLEFLIFVPMYTFFLLLSLDGLWYTFRDHLPGRHRERVMGILVKIDDALANFFRGRFLVAVFKGVVTWLGLWLTGVPFAFFIGVIVAALSLIPFIGMAIGIALSLVLSFGTSSWTLTLIGIGVTFVIVEVVESVLFPMLIGKEVGLHTVTIFLSVFVFGELFGLFGVLLSVPFACVAKILFVEFVLPEIRELAREKPSAALAAGAGAALAAVDAVADTVASAVRSEPTAPSQPPAPATGVLSGGGAGTSGTGGGGGAGTAAAGGGRHGRRKRRRKG